MLQWCYNIDMGMMQRLVKSSQYYTKQKKVKKDQTNNINLTINSQKEEIIEQTTLLDMEEK